MTTRKKPIYPPKEMPLEFEFEGKHYKFYRSLRRYKKRLMIKIFKENKEIINSDIQLKPSKKKTNLLGIACMKWDLKAGPVLIGKYPKNLEVTMQILLQIYGSHKANNESGMLAVDSNNQELISYYENADKELFFILFVKSGTDPFKYESLLEKITKTLVKYEKIEYNLDRWALIYKKFMNIIE